MRKTEDTNGKGAGLTRREFIFGALASLFLGRRAVASERNSFKLVQIAVGGAKALRDDIGIVLPQEVRSRTTVTTRLDRLVLPLASREVLEYPFLMLLGDGALPLLSPVEKQHLSSFFSAGGFLLVDNVGEGEGNLAFDNFFRKEMKKVLPGLPLTKVPKEHVIFRTFYKIDTPVGRFAQYPFLEGITMGKRICVVYTRNDLTGAMARDPFGRWLFEAVPGGPAQREKAIKLGVNIVMYALLLDYKDEHTHIEYLLKKRILGE
jgi:hypothetical protein